MERSECKKLAKKVLKGNWIIAFAALLIYSSIISALSLLTAGIGTLLLSASLLIALYNVFINAYKKNKYEISDMVKGWDEGITNRIVLSILKSLFLSLWSLLFVIPGIIKGYSYALAEFISRKEPELSGNDCITKSRELMNGHKFDLFLFDLSFIGWYILGALTFGIGFIWILPYVWQSRVIYIDKNIYKVDKEPEVEIDSEF